MLPWSAPRGIERENLGPEQVGLGYRVISAVGGDRGRARTVQRRASATRRIILERKRTVIVGVDGGAARNKVLGDISRWN
ncbi:hypothetical protein L484_010205 [Morus notabilis]|uniref:Uncharacterized protein n=1 Tax=Morus notabilis TaxID=981085 RepID=W9R438_9ROSA|nr:hypothetical protein L484_010205 [Morus notabilis]